LTEEDLNKRVRRLHPAKDARSPSANPVDAERTGRLTVPLVTLHETGDAWVPLSLEQAYRRRTIAAGTDHLLVPRVVRAPRHCGLRGEARARVWCARAATASPTPRRASRPSTPWSRGSSAACGPRGTTSSRAISPASA